MKDKIIQYLINKQYIDEKDKEIYHYGLYVMQLNVFTDLIVILLCLLLRELVFGIFFLLFFNLLRIFWGGYHAKSPVSCFVSFMIIFFINLVVYKITHANLDIILVYALLLIIFFTPSIETKGKLVYKRNEKQKKIICIIYGFIPLLLSNDITGILFLTLITNFCLHYYKRILTIFKK